MPPRWLGCAAGALARPDRPMAYPRAVAAHPDSDQLLREELEREIAIALAEDLGSGDVTALATVPEGTTATARVVQKEPGVLSGLDCAVHALRSCDPQVQVELLAGPGSGARAARCSRRAAMPARCSRPSARR